MGLLSMQHPPHQQQQGPSPTQHLHHSRPPSIVHQQHPSQAHQQQQSSHHSAYHPPSQSLPSAYQQGNQTGSTQDNLNYYNHPSPYSTPGATSGYTSADTSDMMAAAQMPRPPYPPMSYHTPQSNSPASVASPSQHDQHRSLYGQAPSQHLSQSMYYQPQPPYQPMPSQTGHSPYGHHAHHPQQPMTSQANLMMSHTTAPNQMQQHAPQHTQPGMTSSPRPKIEPQVPLQMQKQAQGSPMPQANHQQQPPQMQSPGNHSTAVNPNAAPGPIPATTPLVVRQDGNGVQWIAFEYSRDRVKMEYTIRCDVESVNTDELSADFKQENCVYPRACCPKDQYRGNRLMYETDCNRVGWALAQLNAPLRGKRGLIQRAVDSWRNSNQDPRLRSRRVRRMAKMNNRKQSQGPAHPPAAHMPGHGPPPGLANGPSSMVPSPTPTMESKPSLASMGQPMHHHHAGGHPAAATGGGDEVADSNSHQSDLPYPSNGQSTTNTQDVRTAHVFTGYGGHNYPSATPAGAVSSHTPHTGSAVPAKQRSRASGDDQDGLFPDLPEARKRKFVLVEDSRRGSRLRVRVTLDGVDTNEIPDSFRTRASVYPRSFFPREMQNPPPNALGAHFFSDDASDDGIQDTDGRDVSRRGSKLASSTSVRVPLPDSQDGEVMIPRMRRSRRARELKLNDMGHRMAWLQSRVFSGRNLFLQRALDCYRTKTCAAIEGNMQDVRASAAHFELRTGKRRWVDRSRHGTDRSAN
ncbi:hypothetical protein ISF_01208 [Cordyceps fumosorosea ARSEF 2679]|uniref:DUF8032 domain-containing protein n=1 Tax=Cordyceps fumosorosea (strain ARSEF 2679) TaxID=1081104 RepID=A0A168D3R6_CORFA|nr:hypothetical protein ISF_01208 [Cordyceps fumosorosea ARSEF 2679]OAA72135.1 hypothetical protein ISF_01208 [Cordyceps fumosorosea ARSEF 2679]